MGAEYITTNQTSQYTIDSSDFVVLLPGVSLTVEATLDAGFLANHDNVATLTLHGTVVTYGTGAFFGSDPTATDLASVQIGPEGLVQSLTATGIDMRRSDSQIDNAGSLMAGHAAVSYAPGVVSGTLHNSGTMTSLLGNAVKAGGATGGTLGLFQITNTGSMRTTADAITASFENLAITNHGEIQSFATAIALTDDPGLDNHLTLVNSGRIQGATAAIVATDHADTITNTGTIIGAIGFGDGANRLRNTGLASDAVTAGTGADRVENSGRIEGALDLGAGANAVFNSGRLGAVTTAEGADQLTNRRDGTVEGAVSLGNGADTLNNGGALAGALDLGAGDDTLRNSGEIAGDVLLGTGRNTVTGSGSFNGALTGGTGNDSVAIGGTVQGTVALGDGADVFRLTGAAEAAVSTGAGNDTIWLGSKASLGAGLDAGGGSDTVIARVDVTDVVNAELIDLKGAAALDVSADGLASVIRGNRGANALDGGAGNDQIHGHRGNDVLIGGIGVDTLYGDRGNDVLIGGDGVDWLYGGSGEDVFVYTAVADSSNSRADRVRDFERGRDLFDLTGLIDGPVSWMGRGSFTGSGGTELRYRVVSSGVEVKVDTDGSGRSNVTIKVADLKGLDLGDFLL